MKRLAAIVLILATSHFAWTQVTFDVTTTGTSPEMDDAIEYAIDIWGQYLNSEVPIKIHVIYSDQLPNGTLGYCIPNARKNFTAAPYEDIWYATSLANSIAGFEVNPGELDMEIRIGTTINYYLGTDGDPNPGQYDFVSVFLHEVVHGLGGLSLGNKVGAEGSFGTTTAADLLPIEVSWPFPDLEELPMIWDVFLVNDEDQALLDTALFPNPSNELGSEFTSQQIYFNGAGAVAGNDGVLPRMYAPISFQSGSSLHHFNESTFPSSSDNALFTPSIGSVEVHHSPGPILLGALEDIGWSVNMDVGVEDLAESRLTLYPNPSNGNLFIDAFDTDIDIDLVDLSGQIVQNNLQSGYNDLASLSPGMYLLVGAVNGQNIQERLVIR
jgi:hypothetical protein